MTARFQAGQIHRIITAVPAIKGLPRDPEMTTGESCVFSLTVEIHPGEPYLRLPT